MKLDHTIKTAIGIPTKTLLVELGKRRLDHSEQVYLAEIVHSKIFPDPTMEEYLIIEWLRSRKPKLSYDELKLMTR